jgi:hypothetical protein
MRKIFLSLHFLFLGGLIVASLACRVRADDDADSPSDSSCGDEEVACAPAERCCEHVVAMFSDAGATAPSYVEGRCIPKEEHCADYWCGNRHCEAGFFGAPSVCCISDHAGLPQEFKCAYSELSCPGNTQQLSIRDRIPGKVRTLRS